MSLVKDEPRYVGAQTIANVCKLLAFVVLVVGVVATAYLHSSLVHSQASSSALIGWSLLLLLIVVTAAAGLAFFAYALDLLRGLYEEAVVANDLLAERAEDTN